MCPPRARPSRQARFSVRSKTVSDAFLPVSGEIVEFNAAVDADPSIVNKDPYGEGWLVKVRVSDPAEYDTLLTAEQYTELIG